MPTDPRALEATQAPRETPSQANFIGVLSMVLLAVLVVGGLVGIVLAIQPG